ncbi:MAG: hypothetical protein LBB76_03255 [Azoarcus sp.]|jgi:hypothetical protein|nr:hypothetical protein [Azoarcus sp.]
MSDSYILGQQLGQSIGIWIILYFIFLRKYGAVVNLIALGLIICIIFAIGNDRRAAASENLDSGLSSTLHESMPSDSASQKMAVLSFPELAGESGDLLRPFM